MNDKDIVLAIKRIERELTALKTASNFSQSFLSSKINTSKLADASVTQAKLASNSVNSSKIVDGSITGSDVASSTITASNINWGTLTSSTSAQQYMGGWQLEGTTATGASTQSLEVVLRNQTASVYKIIANGEMNSATTAYIRVKSAAGTYFNTTHIRSGVEKGSAITTSGTDTSTGNIAAWNASSYVNTNVELTSSNRVAGGNWRGFTGTIGSPESAEVVGARIRDRTDEIYSFELYGSTNWANGARITVWSWSPASGSA